MFFSPYLFLLLLAPLVIVIPMGIWCIRAIWITLMPPRWSKPVRGTTAEPVCEMCRYPVRGLGGLRCPECGTDLRRTGIITRAMEMRRRGGLGAALLAVTLLFGTSSIYGISMLSGFLRPKVQTGQVSRCTLTPGGGSKLQTIVLTTQAWTGMPREVIMDLVPSTGPRLTYTIDAHLGTVVKDGSGGAAMTLNPYTLTSLLRDAGLDISVEMGKQQAQEVFEMIGTVDRQTLRVFGTATGSFAEAKVDRSGEAASTAVFVRWMDYAVVACIAVWIVLLLLVIRRRRRILREVDAREAGMGLDAAPSAPSPAGPPPSS